MLLIKAVVERRFGVEREGEPNRRGPEIQSTRASADTDTAASVPESSLTQRQATAMYEDVMNKTRKSNNMATMFQDGQPHKSMQLRRFAQTWVG